MRAFGMLAILLVVGLFVVVGCQPATEPVDNPPVVEDDPGTTVDPLEEPPAEPPVVEDPLVEPPVEPPVVDPLAVPPIEPPPIDPPVTE